MPANDPSVNELIYSLAQESIGFASTLQSEAEKMLDTIRKPNVTMEDIMRASSSVEKTLENIISSEILSTEKLRTALEMSKAGENLQ